MDNNNLPPDSTAESKDDLTEPLLGSGGVDGGFIDFVESNSGSDSESEDLGPETSSCLNDFISPNSIRAARTSVMMPDRESKPCTSEACLRWWKSDWYPLNYAIFFPAALSAYLNYLTFGEDDTKSNVASTRVIAGVLEVVSASFRMLNVAYQLGASGCSAVRAGLCDIALFLFCSVPMWFLVRSYHGSKIPQECMLVSVTALTVVFLLFARMCLSKPAEQATSSRALESGQRREYEENLSEHTGSILDALRDPLLSNKHQPKASHAFKVAEAIIYIGNRLGGLANLWYITATVMRIISPPAYQSWVDFTRGLSWNFIDSLVLFPTGLLGLLFVRNKEGLVPIHVIMDSAERQIYYRETESACYTKLLASFRFGFIILANMCALGDAFEHTFVGTSYDEKSQLFFTFQMLSALFSSPLYNSESYVSVAERKLKFD